MIITQETPVIRRTLSVELNIPGRHLKLPASPAATFSAVEDHRSISDEQARCAAIWDAEVASLDGSLLQSWRWGAFKSSQGWHVERVRVEEHGQVGLAQILIRRIGPFGLAYLPRGPVLSGDETSTLALFDAIDHVCARHRVITLVIEPDRPIPSLIGSRGLGLEPGPRPFQPARTVKVPLLDDVELLLQMRRDTRANVHRAERDGVVVERAASGDIAAPRFYQLLQETATRNDFQIHGPDYYSDVLHHFGEDALLAFARVDDRDAVALIAVRQGAEAAYLYGGSSATHRVRGASALLQFEAMRWARERGCNVYDLWGLPAANPPATDLARGTIRPTKGNRWDGLYQFKTGFGGEIVSYHPTLERRYRPLLGWAARLLLPRYRTAPPPGTGSE